MNLQRANQSITNGIYAATAWLILDLGFLLQEHGANTLSILISRPQLAAGAVIVIACIAGLFYKSRTAAVVLFLLFLVPLVLRMAQGVFPSGMLLLFSFGLLYFFLAAVLGAFSYHALTAPDRNPDQNKETPD